MVYHVFNRSIAKFNIFGSGNDAARMIQVMAFYRKSNRSINYSRFLRAESAGNSSYMYDDIFLESGRELVDIIAYCLMPTHFHLILKELKEDGITMFINNTLNSYTRYFNTLHKRTGPLWESRSKKVLIETDEQLLHVSRYIHLNPVTAYLVNKPEDWGFSSYSEYVSNIEAHNKICNFRDVIANGAKEYREFVLDRVSYQRELARIRHLTID
jgi:putative transposase